MHKAKISTEIHIYISNAAGFTYLFWKGNRLDLGGLLLRFFDGILMFDSLRCGGRGGIVLGFALAA